MEDGQLEIDIAIMTWTEGSFQATRFTLSRFENTLKSKKTSNEIQIQIMSAQLLEGRPPQHTHLPIGTQHCKLNYEHLTYSLTSKMVYVRKIPFGHDADHGMMVRPFQRYIAHPN